MKRAMRIFVCLLLLLQSCFAKEILVPESTSPDGHYAFYARGSGAIGTIPDLCMKNLRTDQVVTNLSAGGYISEVEQAAGETNVLWSPDARWFAVRRRETKRTYAFSLYCLDNGQPRLVETPSYMQNVLGREGVVSRGRYWFEEPVGWGKTESGNGWEINTFTLEVTGRLPDELIKKGRTSELYSYRVVLGCGAGDHTAPSVRLDSVARVGAVEPGLDNREQAGGEEKTIFLADDKRQYMLRKVSAVEPCLPEFTRDGIDSFSSSFGSFDMTFRYQPKENSSLSSQELIEEFKKAFVETGWVPEESTKSGRYSFRHRDADVPSDALCVPYRVYYYDHLAERGTMDCFYVFRCRGEWMSASARLRDSAGR